VPEINWANMPKSSAIITARFKYLDWRFNLRVWVLPLGIDRGAVGLPNITSFPFLKSTKFLIKHHYYFAIAFTVTSFSLLMQRTAK
jgi:hypothetical protein